MTKENKNNYVDLYEKWISKKELPFVENLNDVNCYFWKTELNRLISSGQLIKGSSNGWSVNVEYFTPKGKDLYEEFKHPVVFWCKKQNMLKEVCKFIFTIISSFITAYITTKLTLGK